MSNNKETDIKRPLDSEELTMEQDQKVSGGEATDRPPIINTAYYNDGIFNTPFINTSNLEN